MRGILLVAFGGAAGAVARYLVGRVCPPHSGLPVATIAVNLTGCFAIGAALAWLERATQSGALGPERAGDLRLLLVVGALGGLTTFSAFGQETVAALRAGAIGAAALSVAVQVGLGCAAVALGARLAG